LPSHSVGHVILFLCPPINIEIRGILAPRSRALAILIADIEEFEGLCKPPLKLA
jgi:hypothetical protein